MPCQPIFTPNFSSGPCLYCDGTSEYQPEKLLKCELCRRSAHLTCLKSGIPDAKLLGDNFFVLSCSQCNNNQVELVTRAQMSIAQVLALVLYNLHLTKPDHSDDGYFHYKKHIYNYLIENWERIYSYAPNRRYREKEKTKSCLISGQLSHYPQHFQVNKDGGKRGWYKLVNPLPPAQILFLHQKLSSQSKYKKANSKKGKTLKMVSAANFSRNTSSQSSASSDSFLKLNPLDTPLENVDEEPTTGPWLFKNLAIPYPSKQLPTTIFEDEDDIMVKEESSSLSGGIDVDVVTDFETETQPQIPSSDEEKMKLPPSLPSLFSKTRELDEYPMEPSPYQTNEGLIPLSLYEEHKLLTYLDRISETGQITKELYRLRRKLKLRQTKREHTLPLFDIDKEVNFYNKHRRLMTERERSSSAIIANLRKDVTLDSSRILDRFQKSKDENSAPSMKEKTSFMLKLVGRENALHYIHSPYSLRKLKPYIYRDSSVRPLKVKLLQEIVSYPHRKDAHWIPPSIPSIDYCYVTPSYIPPMNLLARQFFWPGIELSEVLNYPEYTCVVVYGRLLVGFGILVPNTRPNESYISFLFVHPEFRRAGIAKFIMYHLIQTSPGKDITLHVSATNPALIMYQQFGFKVEEFLTDFYDKYLPFESNECKHAMFMRLNR